MRSATWKFFGLVLSYGKGLKVKGLASQGSFHTLTVHLSPMRHLTRVEGARSSSTCFFKEISTQTNIIASLNKVRMQKVPSLKTLAIRVSEIVKRFQACLARPFAFKSLSLIPPSNLVGIISSNWARMSISRPCYSTKIFVLKLPE